MASNAAVDPEDSKDGTATVEELDSSPSSRPNPVDSKDATAIVDEIDSLPSQHNPVDSTDTTATVEETDSLPSRPHLVDSKDSTETVKTPESLSSHHPEPNLEGGTWVPRRIHRWKSPILMLTFFLTGLGMSAAHCGFYSGLNGNIVGDSYDQERNIRFGTAFAFLAQITLAASVWLSFTQWLWRSVKKTEMTVNGLNAAFSADTSVFSLLNLEMLWKVKIGSAMAFLAWCLILPSFFTPATLFISPNTNTVEVERPVPYLAIADSSVGGKFAYSPPTYSDERNFVDDGKKTFAGPRTILTLISTATASLGQILPIKAPYNNSTYSIRFYGPIVQCHTANSSVATHIASLLQDKMAVRLGTAKETVNVYYGFVPAVDDSGKVTALDRNRLQTPSNGTNQLWMAVLRYAIDTGGNRIQERHYQVCQLYNATYNLRLEWDRGTQNVQGSYKVLEEVNFPNDRSDAAADMSQHAYSAFLWALTDQLVGAFSWFVEEDQSKPYLSPEFGVIDTSIQHTSLLGSSDLDMFFDLNENNGWYKVENTGTLSNQRAQDKLLERNRTLKALIEELSFNLTASLLHNELLTHNTTTNVTRWDSVNRYGYNARGLFIPYAFADFFTLITILLGVGSYCRNGVLPGKKVQDIVSAAEDPHIIHVVRDRKKSVTLELVDGRPILRPGTDRSVTM